MKIAENIARYDQRDALPYRSQLLPGTSEYDTYYKIHPELEDKDKLVRVHYNESKASQVRLEQHPDEWLANAWVFSTKHSTVHELRNSVDGPVNDEKLEADPHAISKKIKGLAGYLGAGIVGIAKLNQAWVYSHHAQSQAEEWGKPIELNHKYVIVMGFPHTWDLWLTSARTTIPAFMDDWQYYNLMASSAVRLAAAIRDMGYPARAQIQSNYTCLMPPLAVDAGLGEQCRIGICLSKDYGAAFRLCAVTTDLPLIPDPPASLGLEDFCNKCSKCVDVCPSGALKIEDKVEVNGHRVWKQDVYKCFRYWNAKGVSCNICRRACPWSKPRTLPHKVIAHAAQHLPSFRHLLILGDDIVYGNKPRYYPPPQWLQSEDEKMSLGRRLSWWFDHQ